MPTWDEAAQWYLRIVSAPDCGFNELAATTTLSLLGPVRGRTLLDVGCGEGHVARRLARDGAQVTAVEPTEALLSAAVACEQRDPLGITYLRAAAEDLSSIPAGSVDAACAVLVLHHVSDLGSALAELHRVVRDGGVLVAVLPHPWTDHPEAVWTQVGDGPRRVIGTYLREGFWSSGASTPELGSVRDIGWHHRSLATWFTSLAGAGFCLAEVSEPPGQTSDRRDRGGPWLAVPRFLALRATKLPGKPAHPGDPT